MPRFPTNSEGIPQIPNDFNGGKPLFDDRFLNDIRAHKHLAIMNYRMVNENDMSPVTASHQIIDQVGAPSNLKDLSVVEKEWVEVEKLWSGSTIPERRAFDELDFGPLSMFTPKIRRVCVFGLGSIHQQPEPQYASARRHYFVWHILRKVCDAAGDLKVDVLFDDSDYVDEDEDFIKRKFTIEEDPRSRSRKSVGVSISSNNEGFGQALVTATMVITFLPKQRPIRSMFADFARQGKRLPLVSQIPVLEAATCYKYSPFRRQ